LKEIKTPPPACFEKLKKGNILMLAPAASQSELQFKTSGC
jgi:hypothetical protein